MLQSALFLHQIKVSYIHGHGHAKGGKECFVYLTSYRNMKHKHTVKPQTAS